MVQQNEPFLNQINIFFSKNTFLHRKQQANLFDSLLYQVVAINYFSFFETFYKLQSLLMLPKYKE